MGSPDNYSTDISELLHVETVKEAYRASNRVEYMEQILLFNDRRTSLAYMVQTLEYLALKGYYRAGSAKILRLQNPQDRRATTRRARRKKSTNAHEAGIKIEAPTARLRRWEEQLPVPHLAGKAKRLMAIGEAGAQYAIPDLTSCFYDWLLANWGRKIADMTCQDGTPIRVYNAVSHWYRPFQNPEEIERVLLKCAKKGKKWQSRKSKDHSIWVRQFVDTGIDSFQGRKACFPLLYFGYTPPAAHLKYFTSPDVVQEQRVSTKEPSELGFAMIQGTKFVNPSSKPDPAHGFVEVEIDQGDQYIAPIGSIEGPVQLVEVDENSARSWLVNSHIDLETYYYVY